MTDSDPIGLFSHVVKALNEKHVAFIEVGEKFSYDQSNDELFAAFFADKEHQNIRDYLRPLFPNGKYIANGGYDEETGNRGIGNGHFHLVSFGVLYIFNGDLVEKVREGKTLNVFANIKDFSKLWTNYFYGSTAEGYTDDTPYRP